MAGAASAGSTQKWLTLATILVWALWWRNRDDEVRRDYRHAGIAALVLTALTAYIVAAVIRRLPQAGPAPP